MLRGVHRHPHQEQVVYGEPAGEALIQLADQFRARRLMIMTTQSLSAPDGLAARLAHAAGERCVGTFSAISAHSPRGDVVAGANRARELDCDLLVALGGGSVIDAVKAMQLCLWENLRQPSDMDRYHVNAKDRPDPAGFKPTIRMIAIPTTLSAAEFTITATLANHQSSGKDNFAHPQLIPRAVILDPAVTVQTPAELWFSTGIKAVDHAVEQLCNPLRAPFADAVAAEGLRWLSRGLPACHASPVDLDARLACQFGMWLAISGATGGRGRGASHAIGHSLGAVYGVPHGMTSCVTLPAVLRWNEPVDRERQRYLLDLMGATSGSAADAVKDLCIRFGLPTDLKSVGIGPDLYRAVADDTMHDPGVRSNPRPIRGPDDLIDILRLMS